MNQTKNWPGKTPQRVVCAACRSPDKHFMVVGPRHWDNTMLEQIRNMIFSGYTNDWQQGFIDQFGDYLTRQEAWVIANERQQIIRRVGGDDKDGGTLYSENLY